MRVVEFIEKNDDEGSRDELKANALSSEGGP
jgi:hypothetical protein